MNIIYNSLVYVVWFLSTYFIMVFLISLIENKEKLFASPVINSGENLPKVSIIISAFNEEAYIANSIESLNALDYPKGLLEIIIVNDGSTDRTAEVVLSYSNQKISKKLSIYFIDNDKNKGKAACLNQAIEKAHGELVACMDADSVVDADILKKIVPYFNDEKIGAVTVPVEVKEPKTLLEKVIELEYILGLSLFLKIFTLLDTAHVTPGPFSIYRKSLLDKIGGFDKSNITEDLEIAYRIHKARYRIACCMNTKVRTLIPNNFKGLYHQRKRWYAGAILTAMQHRRMLFNREYGLFGFFVPFNFAIIFLGMVLFLFSNYLFVSNIIKNISLYALTNYNFLAYFSLKDFDPLTFSIYGFFGISSIFLTIMVLIIGMHYAKKTFKNRIAGSIGFVFLFFLYQFFWFMSLYTVLIKRKIRW